MQLGISQCWRIQQILTGSGSNLCKKTGSDTLSVRVLYDMYFLRHILYFNLSKTALENLIM
jgi:hypothetical protein